MTADPLAAIVDQLAACCEQLTRLDAREAAHHAALTAQLTRLAARPAPGRGSRRVPARPAAPLADTRPPRTGRSRVARLRGWVEQVYRPGYGHLAAALGPCWAAHDLCLYGLDILAGLWSVLYLQPGRDARLLSAQAEYQARILPALAAQLALETTRCGHAAPPHPPEHAMTSTTPFARPWPTPPAAGRSSPASPDARPPPPRTASATPPPMSSRSPPGSPATPGRTWPSPPAPPAPTSWTSTSTARTQRVPRLRPAAPGRAAGRRRRLRPHPQRRHARLLHRHPPALRPPARLPPGLPVRRRLHPGPALPHRRPALPAVQHHRRARHPGLGRRHLAPGPRPAPAPARRAPAPPGPRPTALDHLARWVAARPEGNRNAGLFWAANRALDTDPAADLSLLAAAARQAGLGEPEITRTLDSARRTAQGRPEPPGHPVTRPRR